MPLRCYVTTAGLALVVVAIDQVVKRLVVEALAPGGSYQLIPGILDLSYRENSGTAFSAFRSAPSSLLVLISLFVLGIFMALIYPHLRKPNGIAAGALVLGGAIGNIIDRIRLHHVIDYIDLHVWPVFNFADMAIVIGVSILLLMLLFSERVMKVQQEVTHHET